MTPRTSTPTTNIVSTCVTELRSPRTSHASKPDKPRSAISEGGQITEFGKYLYRIPEAMDLLSMGRSTIYEQIRSGRLRSVQQGRARLISESAIRDYVALLEREAREAVHYDATA